MKNKLTRKITAEIVLRDKRVFHIVAYTKESFIVKVAEYKKLYGNIEIRKIRVSDTRKISNGYQTTNIVKAG
jgi:hypothetical protein